jgi:hypothetical protein
MPLPSSRARPPAENASNGFYNYRHLRARAMRKATALAAIIVIIIISLSLRRLRAAFPVVRCDMMSLATSRLSLLILRNFVPHASATRVL